MSPHQGGAGVTWGEMMQMSLKERDLLAERVGELREYEFKILKARTGVK